jgi:hypothetical protein
VRVFSNENYEVSGGYSAIVKLDSAWVWIFVKSPVKTTKVTPGVSMWPLLVVKVRNKAILALSKED